MKKRKNKDTGIVFNVENESKRAAILKTMEAFGEFRVEESDGIITLYLEKSRNSLKHQRSQKIKKFHLPSLFWVGASAPDKYSSLVENVAKIQNISLANNETGGAVYSGIIATPEKKNRFFMH